jgi:hypothetical protein
MELRISETCITVDGRPAQTVTEKQRARSPVLQELCALAGAVDLPLQPHVFRVWQEVVEGEREYFALRIEDACDLFQVSLACHCISVMIGRFDAQA